MIITRELSKEECDRVVELFQSLLATSNQRQGNMLADEIDQIVEQANEVSFARIAKQIHQKNLPMMMKLPRVTRNFRCYVVDRVQIGTYPPRQTKTPPRQQRERVRVKT